MGEGTELRSVCGQSDANSVERTRRGSHAGGRPRTQVGQLDPLTTSDSSDLQRMLLDSPDTVTHFLETITGELIFADVLRQYPVAACSDNGLGVTAGHAMIHRIAVLKGRTTDLPYIYAESMFVPERLPEQALTRLERTSDPIGRVLVAHGVRPGRQSLPQPERAGAHTPGAVAEFASEIVWSRSYRLTIDGLAVFAIREWFLRSVLDALDRQARD